MSFSDRALFINNQLPQLVVDVELYSTEAGGKTLVALPGWGCPCMVNPEDRIAYDAWPILGDIPLKPGERRRLGLVFSNPEAREVLRAARTFYLWEGKTIGEARVVDEESLSQVFD